MDQLVQIDAVILQRTARGDHQTRKVADLCWKALEPGPVAQDEAVQKIEPIIKQISSAPHEVACDIAAELNSPALTVRERALLRLQKPITSENKPKRELKLSLNLAFTPKLPLRLNETLPISAYERQLISLIGNHKITIVSASTGSGKSTQIGILLAKYCMAQELRVVITQPRRLSCLQLQARVTQEMNQGGLNAAMDGLVGYKVRFDQRVGPGTRIVFETDGYLLQELQHTFVRQMNEIGYLVIDEAHEQSVQTELLLGLVRNNAEVLRCRVVVMSATLETAALREYFGSPGVLDVPGRLFPIERLFAQELVEQQDRQQYGMHHVMGYILSKQGRPSDFQARYAGTLIFFLPGAEEIARAYEDLQAFVEVQELDWQRITILQLHSKIPAHEQSRVFLTYGPGQAVVILATNIAETSLTIPNCTCVVDSGLVKLLEYNSAQHCNALCTTDIDKASVTQRAGRAGRVAPGLYIACFQEEQITKERNKAEIARVELTGVLLQLLKLYGGRISEAQLREFRFIHQPQPAAFRDGLQKLQRYGLLLCTGEPREKTYSVTKLGRTVANAPVDLHLAIALQAARNAGCLDVVAKIAAFISTGIPLQNLLEGVQNDFLQICNYVDLCIAGKVVQVSKQQQAYLLAAYKQLAQGAHAQETTMQQLTECLIPGFRDNVAQYDEADKCYYRMDGLLPRTEQPKQRPKLTQMQSDAPALAKQLLIHPSSSLFRKKPRFILFASLIETKQRYMNYCMEVQLETLRAAMHSWQLQDAQ